MYKFVEDGSERVATITFMEFARACHRVAHHVHPVDSTGGVGQVVAILATCDTILYHALFIGVHKAGMVVRSITRWMIHRRSHKILSPSQYPLEIHLLR